MTPQQQFQALTQKIAAEVVRNAGKGLDAARIFLSARVKETLSVPAPRKRVTPPGGVPYYRATRPALRGAPPRKLSGRLRQTVTSERTSATTAVVGVNAKSDKGFDYPRHHEEHDHPFLAPTVQQYANELVTLVGQDIKVS